MKPVTRSPPSSSRLPLSVCATFPLATTTTALGFMSRLPPHLLYLIIYNPTLLPPEPVDSDDEDAQEQAHVLFYTANDHAVSKDRVLRQVGLAKALANFTTIFDPRASCESIHSQSRRMIMVSPEPNFWIHACFQLEKVPRANKKEEKGKGKRKELVYDYSDASLHDLALRAQILMGYEAFKLIHGSFSSVLNGLSKEALELQLDRFFTVWAWSWDIGKQVPFSDYLGIRVHPLSSQLTPLIHVFEDKLPPHYFPIVLVSSCVVASKSLPLQCPSSLIRRLVHIMESRRPSRPKEKASEDHLPPGDVPNVEPQRHSRSHSKTFLGISGLNVNSNMVVRNWNWSNYLTFGMAGFSAKARPEETETGEAVQDKANSEAEEKKETLEDVQESAPFRQETPVDSQALQDALASHEATQFTVSAADKEFPSPDGAPDKSVQDVPPDANISSSAYRNVSTEGDGQTETFGLEQFNASLETRPSKLVRSFPLSELHVHLSSAPDPLDTHPRLIRYLCVDDILCALVPSLERTDDSLDEAVCQDLSERTAELIDRLKEIVEVEQEKIASAFSSSPVQNVLQKSQHVISTPNQLTYSSLAFSATSWHLHEGKKILGLNPDALEMYSRGQSPQDWHLIKRGLGTNVQGDVYMEIGRKEATLVDVENEITGVLRRFNE